MRGAVGRGEALERLCSMRVNSSCECVPCVRCVRTTVEAASVGTREFVAPRLTRVFPRRERHLRSNTSWCYWQRIAWHGKKQFAFARRSRVAPRRAPTRSRVEARCRPQERPTKPPTWPSPAPKSAFHPATNEASILCCAIERPPSAPQAAHVSIRDTAGPPCRDEAERLRAFRALHACITLPSS